MKSQTRIVTMEPTADPEVAASRVSAMLEKLKPVANASAAVVGGSRKVSVVFLLAAVALWVITCLPFGQVTTVKVAVVVAFGFILLVPGVVWWLLSQGLQQVSNLPGQLMRITDQGRTKVQSGVAQSVVSGRGFLKRIFVVLRAVVDLRKTGVEGKMFVVESTALLRMFNPLTFVVALVTFVGGMLMIVILSVIGIFQYLL